MKIQTVIETINQMQAEGVIDRYAIGGAVGATFYLEPVATLDVNIFVAFRTEPGRALINPSAIFDYLRAHGGVKGRAPGCSVPSTSRQSRWRQVARRIKLDSSSSSSPARSTSRGFRKSLFGTA